MSAIAPRLVELATVVSKLEDRGIHVVSASADHYPEGATRIAVRGGAQALNEVVELSEGFVKRVHLVGDVSNPLHKAVLRFDALDVTVVATGVVPDRT